MASSYEISARDLSRLVAMLQRQPLGTLYRDGKLRVVEAHNGNYTVTDVEFKPIERGIARSPAPVPLRSRRGAFFVCRLSVGRDAPSPLMASA